MAAHAPAFAELDRALRRRRLARLDSGFRLLLLALALMVAGFTYWQVRVPLDGAVRAGGVSGGIRHLALALAALVAAAGALAAERVAAWLREPPGPEWAALPLPASAVLAHLRTEARAVAAVTAVPAAAALAAGLGLLPPAWLALLAAATVLAWLEVTRAATALVTRLGARRDGADAARPWAERALVPAARAPRRATRPAARWATGGAGRALLALDARRVLADPALRPRLAAALAAALLAVVAWASPAPPPLRRAQSFAAFLPACAALGALALGLSALAPASFTGALPVGLARAWRARALALVVAVGGLALALAATALLCGDPGVLGVGLLWLLPGGAVALLGLHHGLTLPGRLNTADGFYLAWLGVAVVASLMIPFLGWAVLAGALAHSLRTLPRGEPPEVD